LPDMVLLSGDVRAQGLLKAALGQEAQERLVEIPGGTRSVALESESFRAEVAEATEEFVRSRQHELIERFRESQGRDGASVGGAEERTGRGACRQPPAGEHLRCLRRRRAGRTPGAGAEGDRADGPGGSAPGPRRAAPPPPSRRAGSIPVDTKGKSSRINPHVML